MFDIGFRLMVIGVVALLVPAEQLPKVSADDQAPAHCVCSVTSPT